MADDAADPAPTTGVAWAAGLAATGAWAAAVPYVGHAVGLTVEVPASTEIADHVVPGAVTLLVAALLAMLARRGRTGDLRWLALSGLAFLAGFWATSTHVGLLLEAARGLSPWDAALLHTSAGPLVAIAAGRMLALDGAAGGSAA